MTADAVTDVLELLREQASLYARLEQFAASQRKLVRDEDPAPLLALLADRQRLSAELTGIANRLTAARESWNEFRQRLAPAQRKEADDLVRGASDSLRRVIESDEQDARLLAIRKQRVQHDLRETRTTSQAIAAYGSRAAGTDARRLDHST